MYRNHLEKLARTRLDDILLDEGVIDRGVAEDALAEQEMTGRPLSEILMERKAIDEWDLAKIVATHYGLPFIDVTTYDIPREARALLPDQFCRERLILPLDTFGHTAAFAVVEIPRLELVAEIERISGKSPFLYVAVRRPIMDILDGWEVADRKMSGGRSPRATIAAEVTAAPAQSDASGDAAPESAPVAAHIERMPAEKVDSPPEPTAHVPPPNDGVLGPLPALTLALGSNPGGVGVSVANARALGRMSERAARGSANVPAAPPPPSGTAAAPVTGGEPASWQSIFDEP